MEEEQKISRKEEIKALMVPFNGIFIEAIIFFLAAGHLNILRAWLFFTIMLIGTTIGSIITWKYNRDLYRGRSGIPPDTPEWDRRFLAIYFFIGLIIIPIVAGLDIGRFQWSNPYWSNINFLIIGVILMITSIFLVYWAMLVNRHFEGTVRIQKDRAHKVIAAGPYRVIRHPGYLGMIVGNIAIPLILGSFYTFIPAAIAIVATIIRTSLEDKLLQNELNGYSDYASWVKYRLFPGIW